MFAQTERSSQGGLVRAGAQAAVQARTLAALNWCWLLIVGGVVVAGGLLKRVVVDGVADRADEVVVLRVLRRASRRTLHGLRLNDFDVTLTVR